MHVGRDYQVPDVSLESLLDTKLRKEIREIVVSNAAAPWATVHDGIEFGAACLGETLRAQRKISVEELTDEDRSLLNALLYSSLAIYFGLQALAARFDIRRIVYFGDYAYFLPPQIFANRHGIPVTHISHAYNRDIDRRYVVLWPGHGVTHMLSQVERWHEAHAKPITPRLVEAIADGALYRLYGHGGASTYSPNWIENSGDLLSELGLAPGGKLVVAYSNSTDELVCNRQFMRVLGLPPFEDATNPFPSQIAWLRGLVDWIGQRGDLRLVIRLHPRMAVSHRHAAEASEYGQIKTEFRSLPPNVVIVPPESALSSYNIAELADVALTAWSSIGLELARFGVPVIAAFQKIGPFPKSSFIDFQETRKGYFNAIEQALRREPSLESIVEAFRWTHFLHWTSLIDMSDVTPTPDYADVPPYRTPRNRETILKVLSESADLVALNMARLPNGPGALDAERHATLRAIEKFIFYFMTGELAGDSGNGEKGFPAAGTDAHALANMRLDLRQENLVTLASRTRTVERHSPLVARLVKIHSALVAATDT